MRQCRAPCSTSILYRKFESGYPSPRLGSKNRMPPLTLRKGGSSASAGKLGRWVPDVVACRRAAVGGRLNSASVRGLHRFRSFGLFAQHLSRVSRKSHDADSRRRDRRGCPSAGASLLLACSPASPGYCTTMPATKGLELGSAREEEKKKVAISQRDRTQELYICIWA